MSDVFDNTQDLWKCRDGRLIAVSAMTDSHLQNARAWVERRYDEVVRCDHCDGCGRDVFDDGLCANCQSMVAVKIRLWGKTWMQIFDEELKRRRLK